MDSGRTRRLEDILARLDEPKADVSLLMRDSIWELAAADPWLYDAVSNMTRAGAFESALLRLVPSGCIMSGLREDPDGQWYAVLMFENHQIASKPRRSAAFALLETLLRVAAGQSAMEG